MPQKRIACAFSNPLRLTIIRSFFFLFTTDRRKKWRSSFDQKINKKPNLQRSKKKLTHRSRSRKKQYDPLMKTRSLCKCRPSFETQSDRDDNTERCTSLWCNVMILLILTPAGSGMKLWMTVRKEEQWRASFPEKKQIEWEILTTGAERRKRKDGLIKMLVLLFLLLLILLLLLFDFAGIFDVMETLTSKCSRGAMASFLQKSIH